MEKWPQKDASLARASRASTALQGHRARQVQLRHQPSRAAARDHAAQPARPTPRSRASTPPTPRRCRLQGDLRRRQGGKECSTPAMRCRHCLRHRGARSGRGPSGQDRVRGAADLVREEDALKKTRTIPGGAPRKNVNQAADDTSGKGAKGFDDADVVHEGTYGRAGHLAPVPRTAWARRRVER